MRVELYRGKFNKGDLGFLLEHHILDEGKDPIYYISRTPGRKNLSGESVLDGWLGNTNNVYRAAHGLVVVISAGEESAIVEPIKEPEAVIESMGWRMLHDGRLLKEEEE